MGDYTTPYWDDQSLRTRALELAVELCKTYDLVQSKEGIVEVAESLYKFLKGE